MTVFPLSPPPPCAVEQISKKQTQTFVIHKIQGLVEPTPSHPIYHSLRFCIRWQLLVLYEYHCPSPPPTPNPLSPLLASSGSVAQPASLRLAPVPPRHEISRPLRRPPPVALPALLSRPRPKHRIYSGQQRRASRGPFGGLKNSDVAW